MALKLAPLAVAVILALGCAAAGGEEPAPTPAATPPHPQPYPAPGTGGQKQRGWGPCGSYWELSIPATVMFLLVPVMLGFFISGLRRGCHDWKPLVLGLFALGLGTLAAVWELRDSFAFIANTWNPCGPPDVFDNIARDLRNLIAGLVIVLAGGLLTVILRWRNARGGGPDAQEAEEPEPETEN